MILDEIVAAKRARLEQQKHDMPIEEMRVQAQSKGGEVHGRFLAALKKPGLSVIAEVKKASPSKGVICEDFRPREIALRYEKSGADAVSVLTERDFFLGSAQFLKSISDSVQIPVLRKDFIIDIWQVYESRLMGAQAILLISSILSERQLRQFREAANALGMDALVETHDEDEMKKALGSGARIIGINNRNLKTFEVSLDTTERLIGLVPSGKVVVSESGILSGEDAQKVALMGADAVLVGESLMRSANIQESINELKKAGAING